METEPGWHPSKCQGHMVWNNPHLTIGSIVGPDTGGSLWVVAATASAETTNIEQSRVGWLRRAMPEDMAEAQRQMGTFGKSPRTVTEHVRLNNTQRAAYPLLFASTAKTVQMVENFWSSIREQVTRHAMKVRPTRLATDDKHYADFIERKKAEAQPAQQTLHDGGRKFGRQRALGDSANG